MLNLFLQAFDEGWVTDGRGKRVYLSDAIVIMTSNIGSEYFRKLTARWASCSKQVGVEQVQGEIMRELERRFSPEFRNRIDEVVIFRPLTKDEVRADHACSRSRRSSARWRSSSRTLTVTPEALEQLVTGRLQPGLRRALPEARDRGPDQAADQPALDGRHGVHADVRDGRVEIECQPTDRPASARSRRRPERPLEAALLACGSSAAFVLRFGLNRL